MSTHAHAHGTTTPDPPSPSHHLNIPNDDDDDDDEHDQHDEHDGHDDKYPHSDHHTPTQDAIIDVLAHLHPQPQSNDDASDAGYQSFSHQATVTVADQDTREGPAEGSPAVAAGSSAAARASDLASTKPISLKGWSKPQLRDEVLRLRRLLASQTQPPHGSSVQSADANIDPTLLGAPSSSIGPSSPGVFAPATEDNDGPASSAVQASGSTGAVDVDIKTESKRKRKAKEEVVRDGETGKRVERSRRTELGKALRNKMRICMGITEKDPLPPPSLFTAETTDQIPELAGYGVPNWLVPGEANNTVWVDRMANEIMQERTRGQHLSIPMEDMDPEVVKAASRTAFINFCRKYQSDNDPEGGAKRSKYQKGRRRWARKDLKQKKRAKAALDPDFTSALPPSALHLDYMSSEYSSAGPDTDSEDDQPAPAEGEDGMTRGERRQAKKAAREQRWAEEVAKKVAALSEEERENWGVFGFAQGEKVLEIRCPRWRSHQLEDMYKRLDEIAAVHASRRSGSNVENGSKKSGHIAPSHSRFTMRGGTARRGKAPRQGGEGWMWQSGQVGVWPAAASMRSGAGEEGKVDAGEMQTGPDAQLGPHGVDGHASGEASTLQDLAGLDHGAGNDHGHWRDGHGDAETGALVDALVGMVADHD